MSEFELPKDFGKLIESTYDQAFKSGDIVFNESTSEIIEDEETEIQFNLTLATGLAKKPTPEDSPEQIKRPKDFNPFLNPDPKLTVIANYANKFNILLNKFPITPNHILLTTKEFKSQNSPLSPEELIASLRILDGLEKSSTKNEKFFGFYNCGENSGASQPHKHLQFLRYPDNFTPFPNLLAAKDEAFIASANKEPLQDKNLPFAHFLLPLPKSKEKLYDEEYLALAFSSLLQRTLTILRDTESPVAYNVVITKKWLLLVPRSNAIYKNVLGINSAAYTGLILAKNEELYQLIKDVGPLEILKELGFASTADQPTDEYHY
ncbi:hypothetical protein WICMUC_005291 [Wickerhamomyces mucosus]|uniref:ATP adenylyltransferase n=1 Tax=Wickerhamomyces mucosus TaxID=1378264 RepID=A0A9P8T6T5_9ASCO|nr:hypothetical protein WICMUC_005291 [Wickerhamomyces mucosus]